MSKSEGARRLIRRAPYLDFMQEARRARRKLTKHILRDCGSEVQAGPLSGTRLNTAKTWGNDLVGQLLGLYEQRLFAPLLAASGGALIDVGAADGYWAVGLVAAGHYETALCFEIRSEGREAIREMAALNGVSDRITVAGEAIEATLLTALQDAPEATLLIDIEAAEFELLTTAVIEQGSAASFVIELHPWNMRDGAAAELEGRFKAAGFRTARLGDGERDASALLARYDMHDYLRAPLVTRGRRTAQEWLVARPA